MRTKAEKSRFCKFFAFLGLTLVSICLTNADMKLTVSVNEELFEWVRDVAESNHRSVAGQVRFFLDRERQTNADVSKVMPVKEVSDA